MTCDAEDLELHYFKLQQLYETTDVADYAALVVPSGNAEQPVHRWFHLKEAFSHQILARVLKDHGSEGSSSNLRVFDPFAGSGTTGVSLGQLVQEGELASAQFLGVETHPFLHLLAATKIRSLQIGVHDFGDIWRRTVRRARRGRLDLCEVPDLSTFSTRYFPTRQMEELLQLKAAIRFQIDRAQLTDHEADLLMVILGATVEPSSLLRKDGRALRRTQVVRASSPIDWFAAMAQRVSDDLTQKPIDFAGTVENDDSRKFQLNPAWMESAHYSIFSPPYPNNIDYTEVYKLESWFLGLTSSQDSFRAQRHRSIRSHGSLRWPDTYSFQSRPHASEVHALLTPILNAIPVDRYSVARRQLVLGYADDMLSTLITVRKALRPGGKVVCVVGNSLHGHGRDAFVLAADLVIARLAELSGLEVQSIEVARYPARRRSDSKFLRESVVIATKR